MKRFLMMFLSALLVAAWCMPAAALDVKMKGSYIVMGIYEDNRSITDEESTGAGNQHTGASMAYYSQRLRLEPSFKISDGLTFNMRADVMTRVWGQTAVGSEAEPKDQGWLNTRNYKNEQNIQIKRGWVDFTTKLGQFNVGYMADGLWGTDFGNTSGEGPQIVYTVKTGPVLLSATLEKIKEGRLGASGLGSGYTDSDQDKYWLNGTYLWQGGETGLLLGHMRYADMRPAATTRPTGTRTGGISKPPSALSMPRVKSNMPMANTRNMTTKTTGTTSTTKRGSGISWDAIPWDPSLSDSSMPIRAVTTSEPTMNARISGRAAMSGSPP